MFFDLNQKWPLLWKRKYFYFQVHFKVSFFHHIVFTLEILTLLHNKADWYLSTLKIWYFLTWAYFKFYFSIKGQKTLKMYLWNVVQLWYVVYNVFTDTTKTVKIPLYSPWENAGNPTALVSYTIYLDGHKTKDQLLIFFKISSCSADWFLFLGEQSL